VDKKGFSRNFRYPSAERRDQIRAAVKERGFRSEQAFLIAACEHEIRQGDNSEATEQFEARMATRLTHLAKQVQGLQTLAQVVPLDVADEDPAYAAVEAAGKFGRLDVFVHNADYGDVTAFEQLTAGLRPRFDDFLGPVR
jgi:NAD(P)-dependent dehydrogenase (short-subunit alcohol dehydrogenase family)